MLQKCFDDGDERRGHDRTTALYQMEARPPEFWSAEQAEHAIVGNYELVALNLQPTAQFPTRDIGWELFGPPERQTQLATGKCATFEEAKAAAEAALAAVLNPN